MAETLHLSQERENRFPYLITLYKTRRMRDSLPFKTRSKYIVIPERVVEAGNHFVWKHVPGRTADPPKIQI